MKAEDNGRRAEQERILDAIPLKHSIINYGYALGSGKPGGYPESGPKTVHHPFASLSREHRGNQLIL
jgi:hypothetical protein